VSFPPSSVRTVGVGALEGRRFATLECFMLIKGLSEFVGLATHEAFEGSRFG
jgi:hypothetical protein